MWLASFPGEELSGRNVMFRLKGATVPVSWRAYVISRRPYHGMPTAVLHATPITACLQCCTHHGLPTVLHGTRIMACLQYFTKTHSW